jgi:mycobactin lysine-N-oxygenase
LRDRARIDVVLPHGVLYTRDEGYEENRLFSDPDPHDTSDTGTHRHARRWLGLTLQDRREFVRRADRAVFSVQAVRDIARAHNVQTLIGTASALEALGDGVRLTLTYGGVEEVHTFDYVVVAVGFDPLWFVGHMSRDTLDRLQAAAGGLSLDALEAAVGYDLAVVGLTPRLHVPMLGGVAQGPGFPNLSCLGLLAERVLAPYALAMHEPAPR